MDPQDFWIYCYWLFEKYMETSCPDVVLWHANNPDVLNKHLNLRGWTKRKRVRTRNLLTLFHLGSTITFYHKWVTENTTGRENIYHTPLDDKGLYTKPRLLLLIDSFFLVCVFSVIFWFCDSLTYVSITKTTLVLVCQQYMWFLSFLRNLTPSSIIHKETISESYTRNRSDTD